MTEDRPPSLPGLSKKQNQALAKSIQATRSKPFSNLLVEAQNHVKAAKEAYTKNPLVNLSLAESMGEIFTTLSQSWEGFLSLHQLYLKGALHYFIESDDDEHDFASPIGFEDDLAILNACLKLIGRSDLCLNAEDFDDAQ